MAAAVLKNFFKKLQGARKLPSSSSPVKYPLSSSQSSRASSSSDSTSTSTTASGWLEEDLYRVFSKYDSIGDGKICVEELEAMVRAMGNMTRTDSDDQYVDFKAEAAAMMEVADLDGDSYISFHEFVACISPERPLESDAKDCSDRSSGEDEEEEVLKLAFAVYDRNGDGVITAEELHHVLQRVMPDGKVKTLNDCKKMIRAVDMDGDDAVCFWEFASLMRPAAVTC